MESFFSRYKNELVLVAVLFIQIIVLASNVERDAPRVQSQARVSLIRVWTVNIITPVERAFVSTGHFFRDGWRNYIDLHNVRRENQRLQDEVNQLRTEQVRLKENISAAQRLKALLDFKDRFVGETVAAQVIGSSGSEQSRIIYIDKGSRAGIRAEMPVITADGIVGKVREVFAFSAQVLLITDHESGAGVILEKSRLQGVLRGTGMFELALNDIMADEKIEPGEHVITSGGDRIYPKGLPVGFIGSSQPDRDNPPFLAIRVRPAADLARLEEVLVVTRVAEESPAPVSETTGRVRTADILAERLPTVPKTPAVSKPEDSKVQIRQEGPVPAGSAPPSTPTTPAPRKRTGTAAPAGEQPGTPAAQPQKLKKQPAPGTKPAQPAPPLAAPARTAPPPDDAPKPEKPPQ